MCWHRQFRDISRKAILGYLGEGRNTIAEKWFQVDRCFLDSVPRRRVGILQGMSGNTEEEQLGSSRHRKSL